MEFNWEKLQRELKELSLSEKVGADIDGRYVSLVNDFTKEKFPEWREKLGPIVRDIVVSNKNEPQAAAEALILIMLQIVHYLSRHDVLLEYAERFNNKALQSITELDKRTAALVLALVKKGVLSDDDFKKQME